MTWVFIVGTTFQVAWQIYGNTFHYSRGAIFCRDSAGKAGNVLWVIAMVIICLGYVTMSTMSVVGVYYVCKQKKNLRIEL